MGKAKAKKPAAKGKAVGSTARRARKAERSVLNATKADTISKVKKQQKLRRQYSQAAWDEPAPVHLVARLDVPKVNSKYRSYFEFAENTDKKKKLEILLTNDPNPPAGYEFVPIGHPELTNACKEISRENDAMIFIVSRSKEDGSKVSEHVYRTGYHFREKFVAEAKQCVGDTSIITYRHGMIEPIPETQAEINKQADRAIRDLFPRIPNTDREAVIQHAFQKGAVFNGEPTVGLQPGVPLSRRVQLAILAHIRHTHTRYDQLLRETTWINARKAVEPVCLDFLVQWRGDEETGRDQLDEILREVVVISDSEDEDGSTDASSASHEDDASSLSSAEVMEVPYFHSQPQRTTQGSSQSQIQVQGRPSMVLRAAQHDRYTKMNESKSQPTRVKRHQRGFKRYQAAWEKAVNRRHDHTLLQPQFTNTATVPRVARPNSSQGYYIERAPARSRERSRELRSNQNSTSWTPQAAGSYNNLSNITYPPQVQASFDSTHGALPYSSRSDLVTPIQSSNGYDIQDMLVPSIERTAGNLPTSAMHPPRHIGSTSGSVLGMTRGYERGRPQLSERQVIVIDDDTPSGLAPFEHHRWVHQPVVKPPERESHLDRRESYLRPLSPRSKYDHRSTPYARESFSTNREVHGPREVTSRGIPIYDEGDLINGRRVSRRFSNYSSHHQDQEHSGSTSLFSGLNWERAPNRSHLIPVRRSQADTTSFSRPLYEFDRHQESGIARVSSPAYPVDRSTTQSYSFARPYESIPAETCHPASSIHSIRHSDANYLPSIIKAPRNDHVDDGNRYQYFEPSQLYNHAPASKGTSFYSKVRHEP